MCLKSSLETAPILEDVKAEAGLTICGSAAGGGLIASESAIIACYCIKGFGNNVCKLLQLISPPSNIAMCES